MLTEFGEQLLKYLDSGIMTIVIISQVLVAHTEYEVGVTLVKFTYIDVVSRFAVSGDQIRIR